MKNYLCKSLLLSGILLMISNVLFAQTQKGHWLLGGTGSYKHNSYPSQPTTSSSIILNPDVGIFVDNNFIIGLVPSADWEFSKVTSPEYKSSTLHLSIGPFARYYVGVADKIKLFATAHYNLGHDFVKPKQTGPNENNDFYQYRIGLGSAFFLSKTAALEASIGYGQFGEFQTKAHVNILDVQVGFNLYLP